MTKSILQTYLLKTERRKIMNSTTKLVAEIKETNFNYINGDSFVSFSSTDPVWIRKFKKLSQEYPDQFSIVHENKDGSITAKMNKKCLKIGKIKTRTVSEEQSAMLKERLAEARSHRGNK